MALLSNGDRYTYCPECGRLTRHEEYVTEHTAYQTCLECGNLVEIELEPL